MSDKKAQESEFRTGWLVAFAAMSGFYLSATYTFTVGAFIAPLEAEFGWTRAQITFGITIITFSGAFLSPVAGLMVDRWGPRRLGVPGALIFAVTFGLLGLTTGNIWVWWLLWLSLAVGFISLKPLVWATAVASTFDRKRGFALAIALCGSGLASTFTPSLATWSIDTFGWRMAFPFIGVVVGLGIFPILYFGLHSGADKAKAKKPDIAKSAPPVTGVGVREAFVSLTFFKLALGAFLFTLGAMGLVPNLLPILTSFEIGRTEAAAIAGAAGAASIVGRLTTGYLLDRFNPNMIAGTVVFLPVISCLLLLSFPGHTGFAITAALVIGISLGSEVDVVAFLTARQFGMARYGTIFGVISSMWAFASGMGPLTINYIYDVTGGYELGLKLAIPLFLITSPLFFTLGKPLDFANTGQAAAAAK